MIEELAFWAYLDYIEIAHTIPKLHLNHISKINRHPPWQAGFLFAPNPTTNQTPALILLDMEIWKIASLFFGLGAFILFALWGISAKVAEISQTLRRIEARMTLANPLEEERPILELGTGDTLTRSSIRNRAIHPDIWWYRCYMERKDLKGKEYKEERALQRYRERRDRN